MGKRSTHDQARNDHDSGFTIDLQIPSGVSQETVDRLRRIHTQILWGKEPEVAPEPETVDPYWVGFQGAARQLAAGMTLRQAKVVENRLTNAARKGPRNPGAKAQRQSDILREVFDLEILLKS